MLLIGRQVHSDSLLTLTIKVRNQCPIQACIIGEPIVDHIVVRQVRCDLVDHWFQEINKPLPPRNDVIPARREECPLQIFRAQPKVRFQTCRPVPAIKGATVNKRSIYIDHQRTNQYELTSLRLKWCLGTGTVRNDRLGGSYCEPTVDYATLPPQSVAQETSGLSCMVIYADHFSSDNDCNNA